LKTREEKIFAQSQQNFGNDMFALTSKIQKERAVDSKCW